MKNEQLNMLSSSLEAIQRTPIEKYWSTEEGKFMSVKAQEIVPNLPVLDYFCEIPDFDLTYHHEEDAGLDLPIYDERLTNGELSHTGSYILMPGQAVTLKTGVHMGIPKGHYGFLDSRSGTSKKKLDLLCRIIDSPFRGNIRVAIINLSEFNVTISNKDELFQIVIQEYAKVKPVKHNSIDDFMSAAGETARGADGFGSKEAKKSTVVSNPTLSVDGEVATLSMQESPTDQVTIGHIARIAHNVNKAYCEAIGDNSQPTWEDAPEWQRTSACKGVGFHLSGDRAPEDSHISWMKEKVKDGWVYGEVKDPDKKTHPCLVPFRSLPTEQQVKDHLFKAVVDSHKTK